MNRLEDELRILNLTITVLQVRLDHQKNMSYEKWCKIHEAINTLTERRDKLLSEKFRGGIV